MMALSALSIIRLMSRECCQDIAMLAMKNRNETECGLWSLRLKKVYLPDSFSAVGRLFKTGTA